jgi:hypothetical protein
MSLLLNVDLNLKHSHLGVCLSFNWVEAASGQEPITIRIARRSADIRWENAGNKEPCNGLFDGDKWICLDKCDLLVYVKDKWCSGYTVEGTRLNYVLVRIMRYFRRNKFIMRCLHNAHEMNAYRADHVCLCVCPYDSNRERLDGFEWNLVWTLCHWDLP